MATEKKSALGATFYKVSTLNKWFLWSSAIMAVAYLWSIVEDHYKPWKVYQRDFQAIEYGTADSAAGEIWGKPQNSELAGLLDQLDLAQQRLDADSTERPRLVEELRAAELEFNLVNASMKSAKAKFEAERFHYEEYAHEEGETDMWNPQTDKIRDMLAHYKELRAEYYELDEENKAAEAVKLTAKAALDDYDRLVSEVQAEVDDLEREVAGLERIQLANDSNWFNTFRNSIFFDFLQPTVKVRKVVAKELFQELNFLQVPRIDMCMTCHMGIDRFQDYSYEEPPAVAVDEEGEVYPDMSVFLAHPRPELFVTSLSPHDYERFGCSGCHQGNGQRLNFELTWHTPSDPAEKERWKEDLHWHEPHYWDYPMLSSNFVEASCYTCHQDETEIVGAPKWNEGRRLVEKFGCFGCHSMKPFEGYRKVGPSLRHMVSKYQSPEWALKWVNNPTDFRPQTKMPRFFHLENKDDPERQYAEVVALVQYLYNLSTPLELDAYPGNGDAERGKELFGERGGVGCMACHNIDDFPVENINSYDRHGPDLSGIGSKVTPDWLFTWLRNPQEVWPDTNMPNLRLTDQEAADLVAYLMDKRHQPFENQTFSRPEGDSVYEQLLVEKFTERMTEERARQEIGAMSSLDKRLLAGEYLINHHGCFGCHDVAGYEDAKPIGTELNGWGSKHQDRLDFGVFEMGWKDEGKFNREAWLTQKLHNTRYFDRGKDRKPFEQLKMPQYSFAADENLHDFEGAHSDAIEAIMTFVLSLTKDHVADSIAYKLSPAQKAVERGRELVRQKNCYGCHELYGEGGVIRNFIGFDDDGVGYHPPLLNGQGARTQHDWLFTFLSDPAMGAGRGSKAHLRPWMKARMPTFHFTQDELNDLVAYFAHEEVWHTAQDKDLWAAEVEKFRGVFPTRYTDRDLRRADDQKQKLFAALIARNYRAQGGKFLHQTDFPYLSEIERTLEGSQGMTARSFFEDLACVQCHQPGGIPPEGKSEKDMAPSLDLTARRLQPRWVESWFKGPSNYQPGTRMPNLWPVDDPATGRRQSNHDSIQDAQQEIELIRDYLFSDRFARDYREITGPQGTR